MYSLLKRLQNYYFFFIYENYSYKKLIFAHFFLQKWLFSTKISRNLSPSLRIPLVNGCCPSVVMQPHFRFSNHMKQVLISGVPLYFTLAPFLSYPREGSNAIGVNDPIEVVFFDIRQSEHERKELTDIICSLHKRSPVEHLRAGIGNNAPEFHYAGVAATRSIYS